MSGASTAGVEDSRDVEPLATEPDALSREDPVDPSRWAASAPSTAAGSRGGRGIEEAALREGVAGGLEQAEAGRLDSQRVGVDGGDERAAEDVRHCGRRRCPGRR